jgi:ABC-type bacteriocin/lantibiotic exporter with double-glycine peptidase domain
MMPQIYKAIEDAVAKGVPQQAIGPTLVKNGFPAAMVHQAVEAWLSSHGRMQKRTEFKQWLKKYKSKALPATVVIVIISVISSSIALLRPWPTKIMVDSAFGSIKAPGPLAQYTHSPKLILLTSVLTIGIFIAGAIVGTLKDYLVLRLGFWLNRQIKTESLRHILHLPLYHKERLAKGDYIYRQNVLTNSLSDLVLDTTAQIAESVIMIIGILIIMLTFDVRLTLISVILIPFLFVLIRVFGPRLGRISQVLTQINSRASAMITESIDNAETVQSFNLEEKQVKKANDLWWENYHLTMRGLMIGRLYRFTNSLLIIISTSAVMYLGGSAAMSGHMTLGQLLIFMTYMGYLLGPVEGIATEIAARNQKIIDVSRVYEVLGDHEGIESVRSSNHFPISRGQIELQNVTYIYNDMPVLKGVNLVIEPGQKVAIIGPSGAGKTTLLKMMPLFIEPTQGRILVDGVDIQTVSLSELRQKVAWIAQSPQLFSGTILDNLIDADISRQLTSSEIDVITGAANVKEFTDRLPSGLQTPAGESGNSLSGGQKQRIAIARGLLKNAPIICMDEPTAALDNKSENYIRDAIGPVIAGKTVLLVSHRRALLSLMDKIYVMDEGQLKPVEQFGGLDKYMAMISGETSAEKIAAEEEKAKQANAEAQIQEQQKMAELTAANNRVQAKLNNAARATTQDDVVVVISH